MNKSKKLIKFIEKFLQPTENEVDTLEKNLSNESFSNFKNEVTNKKKVDAIKAYTNMHYGVMNNHLRHDKFIDDKSQNHIHHLKQLTKNKTQQSFHAFRTSDSHNHLKKGSVFIDKGFVSTSIAKGYGSSPGTDRAYRIHVSPGTRGHYVGNMSTIPEEKEFILHPGTKFKVGNTHSDEDGNKYTDLHIHSQED